MLLKRFVEERPPQIGYKQLGCVEKMRYTLGTVL